MSKKILVLLCFLALLVGVSCTQDEVIYESDAQQHREMTPYMRALAKLPRVNKAIGRYGTRATEGIAGVIPLCYGDTATNVGGNTGYVDPETWEPPQTDSVYAYVFDYANNQGFTVVTTENNMPDVLMFSYEGNFMETPGPIKPEALLTGTYEEYLQWVQNEISSLLAKSALLMKQVLEDELKSDVGIELGPEGYIPPVLMNKVLLEPLSVNYIYGGQYGACVTQWYNSVPYTNEIHTNHGQNAECWPMVATVANYLATRKLSNSYNGFQLNWTYWSSKPNVWDLNANASSQVAHLFELLSNQDNLKVNYSIQMPKTSINEVPATLQNFGFNGTATIETDFIDFLSTLTEHCENGIPVIMQYTSNTGKTTSLLVDGMRESTEKYHLNYSSGFQMDKTFVMDFFHMQFGQYGMASYIYWGVFDPVHARDAMAPVNPLYNPLPSCNDYINNLKLVKTYNQ